MLLDTVEFRAQIDAYRDIYHDVDKKMATMQVNATRLQNVIDYQTDELAKLNVKLEEVVREKDRLNELNFKSKHESENKDKLIKTLESQVETLKKKNQDEHKQKDSEINQLKSTIAKNNDTINQIIETAKKESLISNTQIKTLESQIKGNNNQILAYQKKITLLENLFKTSAEEVKNKNTEITSLKLDLQSRDAQISEYKQNLEKSSAESCLPFGKSTHLHAFQIPGLKPFVAPCDSQIAGSGWMVIQRRIDGRVDFHRKWDDYKEGFGNVSAEFWLGLEKLHRLTTSRRYEMLVHVVTAKNIVYNIKYDKFEIGSELEQYKLKSLGIKTGIGKDAIRENEGFGFSTFDRDNDNDNNNHIAKNLRGGWWFKTYLKR